MSKSHITLEASELDGDDWTEATLTIERDDEPDEELRFQVAAVDDLQAHIDSGGED